MIQLHFMPSCLREENSQEKYNLEDYLESLFFQKRHILL